MRARFPPKPPATQCEQTAALPRNACPCSGYPIHQINASEPARNACPCSACFTAQCLSLFCLFWLSCHESHKWTRIPTRQAFVKIRVIRGENNAGNTAHCLSLYCVFSGGQEGEVPPSRLRLNASKPKHDRTMHVLVLVLLRLE